MIPEQNLPIYIQNFTVNIKNTFPLYALVSLLPSNVKNARVVNLVLSSTNLQIKQENGIINVEYDFKEVDNAGYRITIEGSFNGQLQLNMEILNPEKHIKYVYDRTSMILRMMIYVPRKLWYATNLTLFYNLFINDCSNPNNNQCGYCNLNPCAVGNNNAGIVMYTQTVNNTSYTASVLYNYVAWVGGNQNSFNCPSAQSTNGWQTDVYNSSQTTSNVGTKFCIGINIDQAPSSTNTTQTTPNTVFFLSTYGCGSDLCTIIVCNSSSETISIAGCDNFTNPANSCTAFSDVYGLGSSFGQDTNQYSNTNYNMGNGDTCVTTLAPQTAWFVVNWTLNGQSATQQTEFYTWNASVSSLPSIQQDTNYSQTLVETYIGSFGYQGTSNTFPSEGS